MNVLLLGLAGMIAAGFGLALLDLTIRRAEVGAALVFLSAIAQAVFIFAVPSVTVGGTRVGITDLVAVVVLAAALARCLRLGRLSAPQRWLIMLGIALLVSLMRGVADYGLQASVSDSRQYLFFVGAALYMATFRPDTALYDRIGRIWLIAAVLMVLLAWVRWLDVFAGINLGVPAERHGVDTAIRVLDGPYTFFLAGPLLLTLPSLLTRRSGQRRWVRWLGAVLLVMLLALDRRTVWLTILVGAAVLVLRGRRLRARAVMLIVGAAIVIGLAFAADGHARDQAPPGGVTSTGSVTWRVEGWSDLLDGWSGSPVNWLAGQPFGSGFVHTTLGEEIDTVPHNFYIETMIRAGLGGLIALIVLTVGLLRKVWRVPTGGPGLFDPSVLPALLAMQLVWYLMWVPGLEQGVVTGMAVAVAATGVRRSLAGRRRTRAISGPPHSGRWDQVRTAAASAPPGPPPARRRPPTARRPSRDVVVAGAPAADIDGGDA
ncbi:O-antigen ligase family protein [Geodermatophilus sp. SYSU D01180]